MIIPWNNNTPKVTKGNLIKTYAQAYQDAFDEGILRPIEYKPFNYDLDTNFNDIIDIIDNMLINIAYARYTNCSISIDLHPIISKITITYRGTDSIGIKANTEHMVNEIEELIRAHLNEMNLEFFRAGGYGSSFIHTRWLEEHEADKIRLVNDPCLIRQTLISNVPYNDIIA